MSCFSWALTLPRPVLLSKPFSTTTFMARTKKTARKNKKSKFYVEKVLNENSQRKRLFEQDFSASQEKETKRFQSQRKERVEGQKPSLEGGSSSLKESHTENMDSHQSHTSSNQSLEHFAPRHYQLEIFEKAKENNIIAVLDTGSGKTMIALLLLKHINSLSQTSNHISGSSSSTLAPVESKSFLSSNSSHIITADLPMNQAQSLVSKNTAKKVSVFFVPTVPLVTQQANYLRANSVLKIGHAWGGSESQTLDQTRWDELMEEHQVIVMTPLLVLNALDRGFVRLNQFNLFVFDECHHARASHPYCLIMKFHFAECPPSMRPKIFGMTASPCSAKESPEMAIERLEKTLYATAITSNHLQLNDFVTKPVERIVYYEEGNFFSPPPLYVKISKEYQNLLQPLKKEIADALGFCDQLGTWAAERALELAIEDLIMKLQKCLFWHKTRKERQERSEIIKERYAHIVPRSMAWFSSFSIYDELDEDESAPLDISNRMVVNDYNQLYSVEQMEGLLEDCRRITETSHWGKQAVELQLHEISPKVQTLVNILLEFKSSNAEFCGMIFCKQRITARILEIILRSHPALRGFVKSGCLIGHGSTTASYKMSGMTVALQQTMVSRFRSGRLNLLVATQVAEEGLDIRPCNCVIRFDIQDMNLVNYMQSRGRARHVRSQFIFLAPNGDPIAQTLLDNLQNEENKMKTTLFDTEVVQESMKDQSDFEDGEYTPDETKIYEGEYTPDESKIYQVPTTGAYATLHNSIQFINEYCLSLPRDSYYNPKPDFVMEQVENGFIATLYLPRIFRNIQESKSQTCSTVTDARRHAAFNMIKHLHAIGELNDNLRPQKVILDTNRTKKTKSDVFVRNDLPEKKMSHIAQIPKCFSGTFDQDTLTYINLIALVNVENDTVKLLTLGFLSFKEISDPVGKFPFKLCGQNQTVKLIKITEALVLTTNIVKHFRKFHSQLFRSVALENTFGENADWATLIVPLKYDSEYKVSFQKGFSNPAKLIDWDALDYCENIDRNDKSLLDDPSIDFEYVKEMVLEDPYRSGHNHILLEILSDVTPATEIENDVTTVRDLYKKFGCKETLSMDQFLIRAIPIGLPFDSEENQALPEVLLVPQVCLVCPIKRGHIESALSIPILMRHITHRLNMLDILDGAIFPDSKVRLSLSLDSLCTAFTAESARLDTNYERLETLGDSFLRVQLSLHTFLAHPNRHEGFLANARMNLETNRFLSHHGMKMNLEAYILSHPFSRKFYTPPIVHRQEVQNCPEKTVADVVEAVIGASFVDHGIASASDSISFFLGPGYLNWTDYSRVDRPFKPVEPEMLQCCAFASAKFGYSFNNLSYLVEALTHPSAITGSASYGRLDFLGDAILGFAITQKLYSIKPALDPGAITCIRSELTCNQFLASLSCFLGLPSILNHMSGRLGETMANWTTDFMYYFQESNTVIGKNAGNTLAEKALLFWKDMKPAPKAMGYIFGAIIGAIFVDCGYKFEVIQQVLDDVLFKHWWLRFEALSQKEGRFRVATYMKELQRKINDLKCHQLVAEIEDQVTGMKECRFLLHDIKIGSSQCQTRSSARKNAARDALAFLSEPINMNRVKEVCTCQKTIDDSTIKID